MRNQHRLKRREDKQQRRHSDQSDKDRDVGDERYQQNSSDERCPQDQVRRDDGQSLGPAERMHLRKILQDGQPILPGGHCGASSGLRAGAVGLL